MRRRSKFKGINFLFTFNIMCHVIRCPKSHLSPASQIRPNTISLIFQWLTSRKNLELQNRPKWDFWLRFDLACNDQARRHCRTPASNFKSGEAPPPPHQTSASVPDPNLELRELKCTRICKVTISIHFGEQVNQTSRSSGLTAMHRTHIHFKMQNRSLCTCVTGIEYCLTTGSSC